MISIKNSALYIFVAFALLLVIVGCKPQKTVDLSSLKGKWQMNGTNEQILIDDTVIHYLYLGQGVKYRYEIKDDTLLYVHFDLPGDSIIRVTEFGIRKLNKKEMEIDNGGPQTATYKRID